MRAGPACTLLSVVLFVFHRPVFVSARRPLDISTDPPLPPLPPPPLPTYFVTNLSDFRQRWREVVQAATDAVIEIAPGSYFPIRKQLVCAKDIHLTIFSSGSGATLDGAHKSRIFKVKGCSLTLRGLSLVNGYAPAALKQECRNPRTGEWEPYSLSGEYTSNEQLKPECVDSVRCASHPGTPTTPIATVPPLHPSGRGCHPRRGWGCFF